MDQSLHKQLHDQLLKISGISTHMQYGNYSLAEGTKEIINTTNEVQQTINNLITQNSQLRHTNQQIAKQNHDLKINNKKLKDQNVKIEQDLQQSQISLAALSYDSTEDHQQSTPELFTPPESQ